MDEQSSNTENGDDEGTPKSRRGKYISLGSGKLQTEVVGEPAPPFPEPPVVPVAPPPSSIDNNIAGLLSYLIAPAIAFVLIDPYKSNHFIRFHSFQAISLYVTWVLFEIGVRILSIIPGMSFLLIPVVALTSLGLIAVAIGSMYKAYNNEEFKLPIVGDIANNLANTPTL